MPTEHEYKYVIKLDAEERIKLSIIHEITQGYLPCPDVVRIRRLKLLGDPCIREMFDEDEDLWTFTYKKRIGQRVVEIETYLDQRDGEDLLSECKDVLMKRRFAFENNEGEKWDIDFFFDEEGVYFASAEVELPEGSERPSVLPDLLKNEVIYEVLLTDDRFSNKNLTNKWYAKQLYEQISKGTK